MAGRNPGRQEGYCHALIRDSSGSGASHGRVCGDVVLRGEKSEITDREMAFDRC